MSNIDTPEKDADSLTPKQHLFLAALLVEPTNGLAAEKAGVSLATGQRWLRDPSFRAELRGAEVGVLEAVSRKATDMAIRALELLDEVIADTAQGAGIRVRAALGLLDQVVKLRAHADIEDRLTTLEALIATQAEEGHND